jgi:hypothetical protein
MTTVPLDSESRRERMVGFYRRLLGKLDSAGTQYLVGGSYAAEVFTGIPPHTKDLDIFIRQEHMEQLLAAAVAAGFRCEVTFPHWLAKIFSDDGEFVDVIFGSGNGICVVDDGWFEHSLQAHVLDHVVNICPAEEMIWSKAFIMERERFDGADIAHFLRLCGKTLDWPRLVKRFGPLWRVLMFHLLMFGFVYPHLRDQIPQWVMQELIARLQQDQLTAPPSKAICFGTLLSREQYLSDIEQYGMTDARLMPTGLMTPSQIADWTNAIGHEPH